MSTNVKHYAMIGVSLKNFGDDEKHEDLRKGYFDDGKGDFGIIVDAMSGEYVIAGFIVDEGKDDDGGLGMTTLSFDKADEYARMVDNWLDEHGLEADGEIGFVTFTHWS